MFCTTALEVLREEQRTLMAKYATQARNYTDRRVAKNELSPVGAAYLLSLVPAADGSEDGKDARKGLLLFVFGSFVVHRVFV